MRQMMVYYSFESERYDTYEEAENDARKAFEHEFVDYFDTLIKESDIDVFDILEALHKGDTNFYYEVYEKCFNRYKDDYLVEVEDWEEEEEDYEDYDLESGFDPYEGCYTWDC